MFMKNQAGALGKYAAGGIPIYRLDIKFGLFMLRKRYETYEYDVGIRKKSNLTKTVESLRFDLFMGLLIMINGVTVGISTNYRSDAAKPDWVRGLEHLFTLIFVVEFFLRLYASGIVWLMKKENL